MIRDAAWAALGIAALLGLWAWASLEMSPLVLPSPAATARAALQLVLNGGALAGLTVTTASVVAGYLTAMVIGTGVAGLGGATRPIAMALSPLVTMQLAVPPIAWVVLAMMWFGVGRGAVLFTVVVALVPIFFVAVAESLRTLDPDLGEMARAYRLSPWARFRQIVWPQVLAGLIPAGRIAFGLAWKLTVMAELLAARSGVGDGLAMARTNLATAESFAWIGLVVATFLLIEAAVVAPLIRCLEPWRGKQRETVGATA